jgi:hypothetical protein
MKKTLYVSSAIALTLVSIGGAGAATPWTMPLTAPAGMYQTVDDVTLTVRSESAQLRDRPELAHSTILDRLPRGTRVTITERDGSDRWAKTTIHGKTGWIDVRQLGVSAGGTSSQ